MMEGFFEWMLEASLLTGMILVIRHIFMGKIRYGVIYALWGLVLLRFLIPVNMFATPFSIENILSKTSSVWETAGLHKQEKKNETSEGLWQEGRGALLAEGAGKAGSKEGQEGIYTVVSGKKGSVSKQEKIAASKDAGNYSKKAFSIPWSQFLPVIWAVASAFLLLWLFLSNITLLGKMKKSSVLYGKKGTVEIYAACNIQTPCLYGFFRPAIYLPYSLVLEEEGERVSKEELEQIITHEYVHYRHRDHIWAMFRLLLVSVCWFNPFAWIAASYSKKDAELFCDETVIHLLGEENRFCYGEMLVRLAGKPGWGDFRYSMLPMSRKGKEMERRIRAISGKRDYSKWVLLPLMAVLCMAAGVTCSAGMDSAAGQKQDAIKESYGSQKVENAVLVNRPALGNAGLWQANEGESMHPYASFAWLEKVLQESGSFSNTFSGALKDNTVKEESGASIPQNEGADTPEEAFRQYMKVFTAAVNTGNTDRMNRVLAQDSDVYMQQCRLVKNYYKRGIREKVKAYSVSIGDRNGGCVEIDSKEKIKVFYADGKSRTVKQSYRYTCERYAGSGDGWLITSMQEMPY